MDYFYYTMKYWDNTIPAIGNRNNPFFFGQRTTYTPQFDNWTF